MRPDIAEYLGVFSEWRRSTLCYIERILERCFLNYNPPPDVTWEPFESYERFCPKDLRPRALVRFHWDGRIERLAPWHNPVNQFECFLPPP